MILCPENRENLTITGNEIVFQSDVMRITGAQIILKGQTVKFVGIITGVAVKLNEDVAEVSSNLVAPAKSLTDVVTEVVLECSLLI